MINSEQTIEYMPSKLAAFKRYINTYECTYTMLHGVPNLVFYHKDDDVPYVVILAGYNANEATIFVNTAHERQVIVDMQPENIIKHDMLKFIEAIRECKRSV